MIGWSFIRARVTLAFAVMQKILLWPFVKSSGAAPWLRAIAAEDLAATPKGAWERLAPSSRCLACGLCDSINPQFAPSEIILGSVRQPGDAGLVDEDSRQQLTAIAERVSEICPARVDVEAIVEILRTNGQALEQGQHP